jgi:hypothetical protein
MRGSRWVQVVMPDPDGCSGAAAAAQLETTVARVYVASSEVKKMLQDEIRKLEGLE